MQLTMNDVHREYMDGVLSHPNEYSMKQYVALELIDKVLNNTVGKVSIGRIYKKMSDRVSKEFDYEEA